MQRSRAGVEDNSERMEAISMAPALHLGATSLPLLQGGPDEHSNRPSKRPRAEYSQGCVQQQRVYGPDEPYVLLSHVQKWWEVRPFADSIRQSVYGRSLTTWGSCHERGSHVFM